MGRERVVSDDDSEHDPALDQPDVSACPLHQMLQLLDACIRRRKAASRAAFDASDVAKESRERARDASANANANATARAGKISVVGGWDDVGGGWNDDEDDAHEEAPREDDLDLTSLLGVGADVGKVVGNAGVGGAGVVGCAATSEDAGDDDDAADSSPSSPRSPSANSVSGFETASDDGDDEGLAAIADDAPPSGVLRDHPDGLALLRAAPPRPLRVPVTQLPAVMTEDAMREREAALEALGDTPEGRALRARVQSDVLLSDMSAFKAANPGACLADFVRWHSPKDWEEEEEDGSAPPSDVSFSSEGGGEDGVKKNAALSRTGIVAPGCSTAAPHRAAPRRAAPRGRLSLRMRSPGNAWQTLWRDAPAAAASAQKPLFDPIREGEKCLHRLDTVPPREVFSQLLAVAAAAVGHVLASSRGAQITPAPEALRRAAERAKATLARPCPYPAERDAVAGELQRAERAVARGESLLFHLPGVPRRALRALLTQAMEDDDARDEAVVRAGEEDLEEDRGEDHHRGDIDREGQSRLEEGGAASAGAPGGGERFGALDRDDEFNFAPRAVEVSLAPGLERYAAEALLPRAAVRSGRGGGGRDEDRREDREDRREDRSGNVYSLADGGMPFPSDSDGGGGGGGDRRRVRAAGERRGGRADAPRARRRRAVLPARELEPGAPVLAPSDGGGGRLALALVGNRRACLVIMAIGFWRTISFSSSSAAAAPW
jgi:Rab3 GTPase-activating protein catalytic subunit